MPDQRHHRGRHPADAEQFGAGQLPALRAAVSELSWLLTRGYGETAAIALVGDHHNLTARQRMAVLRCACPDAALHRRQRHNVTPADCRGRRLAIDGYNLLITVEAALSGGLVLVGRDGCYRDLASVHGTYRRVEETVPALVLILDHVAGLHVSGVDWYLDEPVSNSGRLKSLMAEQLERRSAEGAGDPPWNIELIPSPDQRLRSAAGVVIATCDGPVLDACAEWVHLAGDVVHQRVPAAWIVRLGSVGE